MKLGTNIECHCHNICVHVTADRDKCAAAVRRKLYIKNRKRFLKFCSKVF